MGLSLNNTGSFLGLGSPFDRTTSAGSFARPGFPAPGPFPFGVVHAAIFALILFSPRNKPAPALSFAQVKPRFPALGLFPSVFAHAVIAFFFLYPPLYRSMIPPRIIEVRWNDLHAAPHDSVVVSKLYYSARMALSPSSAAVDSARKPANEIPLPGKGNVPAPPERLEERATAQSMYSGPQEVAAFSPNATNSIQTILRPDLVNPAVLKFPQLLKPVIILLPNVPVIPNVKQPNLAALPPSAQPVKNTLVKLPVAKVGGTASAPTPEIQRQTLPEIESEIRASGRVAVIVLNAVTVPENAPVAVPQAELAGSFTVGALRSVQSTADTGTSGTSTKPSDAPQAANQRAQVRAGEGVVKASETPLPKASDGLYPNSAGNSVANSKSDHFSRFAGTSQGADTEVQSQVRNGVSGVIIVGGTSRAGSRAGTNSTTIATYGFTVISSGTSGGASRDLGVFDRSETVYTVYIPMADVGGGPDWSIQYAILDPRQAGNGLLTPPVVLKKARAVETGDSTDSRTTIIFVSGVISAEGELTVKVPPQMDAHTREALEALRRWEFLPAQLNGIAVAIKVLIGVGILSR